DGLQRVAGATFASRETLRGPTRRSTSGAIVRCQLAAAIWRSLALIDTCARRSASANVAVETGGPVTGPVPNVGGAPGVAGAAGGGAFRSPPRHATTAPSAPIGAVSRNCLRVFMKQIVI